MAFLGLQAPPSVAEVLRKVRVPGRREDSSYYHVTMFCLGESVPISQLTGVTEAAYEVLSKVRPFSVKVQSVRSFPKGSSGYPIICPVVSEPLKKLRENLCEEFDKRGVEYDKKFPVYRPHLTLAYSDEALEEKGISPVEWKVEEVVLWGGDSGADRLVVTFPFRSKPSKTAFSVAVRYLFRERYAV